MSSLHGIEIRPLVDKYIILLIDRVKYRAFEVPQNTVFMRFSQTPG